MIWKEEGTLVSLADGFGPLGTGMLMPLLGGLFWRLWARGRARGGRGIIRAHGVSVREGPTAVMSAALLVLHRWK